MKLVSGMNSLASQYAESVLGPKEEPTGLFDKWSYNAARAKNKAVIAYNAKAFVFNFATIAAILTVAQCIFGMLNVPVAVITTLSMLLIRNITHRAILASWTGLGCEILQTVALEDTSLFKELI